MDKHDCTKSRCHEIKPNSGYFVCSRCKNKCLQECLIRNNDVFEFLVAVKLLTPNENKSNYDRKDRYKFTYTSDSVKRVNTILNDTSLFEFLCPTCK